MSGRTTRRPRLTWSWRKRSRKIYIHVGKTCIHFGRLLGRWSYGIDRPEDDPYGELEG